MEQDLTGNSSAATTLKNKPTGERKKEVIKKIIKKKINNDVFDPSPEIDESDTMIKS